MSCANREISYPVSTYESISRRDPRATGGGILYSGIFRFGPKKKKKKMLSPIIRLGHQTGLIMSAPGGRLPVECPSHIIRARAATAVHHAARTDCCWTRTRNNFGRSAQQPAAYVERERERELTIHLKFIIRIHGSDTDCKNVWNLTD